MQQHERNYSRVSTSNGENHTKHSQPFVCYECCIQVQDRCSSYLGSHDPTMWSSPYERYRLRGCLGLENTTERKPCHHHALHGDRERVKGKNFYIGDLWKYALRIRHSVTPRPFIIRAGEDDPTASLRARNRNARRVGVGIRSFSSR